MTTEDSLLRTIIDNPADDVARLVYADWLDEHACTVPCRACGGRTHIRDAAGRVISWSQCSTCRGTGTVSDGRTERAEFIRVQCDLARSGCPCEKCRTWGSASQEGCLVNRERDLLAAHGRQWARVPWGESDAMLVPWDTGPEGETVLATPHWHRGFVARVEVPALSWVFERYVAASLYEHSPEYAWRVTPWAFEVAGTHPVTEFVMGGLEPWEIEGQKDRSHPWVWRPENSVGGGRERLTRPLFDAIKAPVKGEHGAYYPTRKQALAALATTAADVVREAVLKTWAQ